VLYKVEEFNIIEHSVNATVSSIKHIAKIIFDNYSAYDAFIVLAGEDAICTIGTYLSFMF
jgi:L-asparaginase/Glu-tRNA(Gln) amidotransferase subunit D